MNLNRALPFAAATFVIAAVASMGLPGFSGFVAELMIVIGVWRSYPLLVLPVGLGILIGVVFIWRAMQKAFFSGTRTEDSDTAQEDRVPHVSHLRRGNELLPSSESDHHDLPPITLPEKLGAILLIASRRHRRTLPAHPAQHRPARAQLAFVDGLRRGSWQ